MFGADNEDHYLDKGDFVAALSYRYQMSMRHFVGDNEEKERREQHSYVRNDTQIWDLGLTYVFHERASVTLGIPFLSSTRETATVRGPRPEREVLHRSVNQRSTGLGDMSIVAKWWALDLEENKTGNIQLGLGVKIPTGKDDLKDTQDNGQRVNVDQSIMPGDGGWGIIVDLNSFKDIELDDDYSAVLYAQGTYLINPRDNNGHHTSRGAILERTFSVPDSYVARAGIMLPFGGIDGLGLGVGLRLEGVPNRDLIGSSAGFRRPGYAVSFEPTLAYGAGRHSIAVSVPIALYRNRTKSTSNHRDNSHGDAAFADWFLLIGYSIKI